MPKKTGKDFFLCCLINVPGDHQVNVSWGWSLTQEIVCYPFKTQFHTNHINNQDKDKDIEKDKDKDKPTSREDISSSCMTSGGSCTPEEEYNSLT